MACFASDEGDRIARRFLRLAFLRIAPWRWPRTLRHLRAASAVSPIPPPDALYVDALAVAGQARRRGVARALLDHAAGLARERGCHAVSLDTGIDNQDARLLYEACGFRFRTQRVAPDTRTERAVGGRGFVSYEKHV
jgi:ribosomal protein S18 acetylase RimI-like enzyme